MGGDRDVPDFLSTHTWTTQRARSPRPFNPVRANQSYKLDPLGPNDPQIPRTFSYLPHARFPPPPSVEDEEASVAKESNGHIAGLNDEEPKCKGDKDQFPIILPVPEHNLERRFVLVSPSETDSGDCSDDSNTLLPETKHTANSKAHLAPRTKIRKDEPPPLQGRRSRTDLPRIDTDTHLHAPPSPSSHVHRSRSATCMDQSRRDASEKDYFGPHPESARPARNPLLTPVVINATKGRDRAYWDFNPGANGTDLPKDTYSSEEPRSADRKGPSGYARTPLPSRLTMNRRLHSDMEIPRLKKDTEIPRLKKSRSSYRDEPQSRSRNGPSSPSSDRKRSPPRLSRRESSPLRTRADSLRIPRDRSCHNGCSSPAKEKVPETLRNPRNRSSHNGRSSPAKETVPEYSSDEYQDRRSSRSHRERRSSTVIYEGRSSFLGVGDARSPHISSSRSRPSSPLPSPRLSPERSVFEHKPQPGPRSSTTFSTGRAVSPTSPANSPSPRSRSSLRVDSGSSRPRGPSRTHSVRSNKSSYKLGTAPLSSSTASLPPLEIPLNGRTRQAMPPTPTWSRQSSLDPAPCWQPEPWQPPTEAAPLTPRHSEVGLEQPGPSVVSYRRFSEDVSAGTLPDLPDCPRKRPRAGYTDWFTLPRHDNVNICPSCYEQVLYPTAFRDLMVAAPPRPKDKPLACDLGTSYWYRIAWLMTRKYHRPDLRLLQGIAEVSLRNKAQPCPGALRATRPWHSILDPDTRRCLSSFTVCTPCAEAVQVLFPSLMGVFVPSHHAGGSNEPPPGRAGQCSLHFAPHRARFLAYFDILEDTHDRAVARGARSSPDMHRLAERIDAWAGVDECPREEPLRCRPWYTMAMAGGAPDLTICEDCYLGVVYPELEVDAAEGQAVSAVARKFAQRPQVIRAATVCQMASPWMKDLFRRACARPDGVAYFDARVKDRLRSL